MSIAFVFGRKGAVDVAFLVVANVPPRGITFFVITNIVIGLGFIDFEGQGHQPNGPHHWQVMIDRHKYWYGGEGAIKITINKDGSYIIKSDGNDFSGNLTSMDFLQ